MHKLLMDGKPRMTQFTGSSRVGEILAKDLSGKIKLEDAVRPHKYLAEIGHEIGHG